MRRITTLMTALVVVLAGCGGDGSEVAATDASPAAVTATTLEPPTTTQPQVDPDLPKIEPPEIEAKVVFDGATCSYAGPLVVPAGVKIGFDFDATAKAESVALVVLGVAEGTTWEEVLEGAEMPASGPVFPEWAKTDKIHVDFPGTMTTALEAGEYVVTCNTAPSDTDRVHPAALLEVMPQGLEAKVVFDGEACSYDGPTLVPAGTKLDIDFEATARPDFVALVVLGVVEGTTWEEVVEGTETIPASGPAFPEWARTDRINVFFGPGTMTNLLQAGEYAVTCNTAPEDTDKVHPAALIEVTRG